MPPASRTLSAMDPMERKQSLALESWRALRILSEFVDGVETMSKYPPGVSGFGSARLNSAHLASQQADKVVTMFVSKGLPVLIWRRPGYMEPANTGFT